jgi:NADPH:quinone reductase-like Zn-dependent oxidoreductase
MKAIRIHSFGGPETLSYEEAPQPTPARGEVLIRVHAAGVNPVDAKIRSGEFPRFRPQLPAILGRDISGVVVNVGPDVSDLAKDDEVFGMLDYDRGAYAEYAVASTREISLAPAALEHEQLAALPVAALTAWQALFEHGKLQRGQRVLIHGANGGVGHFAAQLGLWSGAEVVGTCAEEDVDFVRDLGVETVIDYQSQRFEDEVRNLDLVLDLVAGETRRRSWKVLKPGGILVSTLPDPKPEERHDVSGREVVVYPAPVQLGAIARLLATGAINVAIDRVFPIADIPAAHHRLEKEHSRGKTVAQIFVG